MAARKDTGLSKFQLPLSVVANREVDGVEMGVLSDGTPFLGARGLARLCGVAPSVIIEWGNEWSPTSTKPRDRKINAILAQNGAPIAAPFIPVAHQGATISAFPESVCIAVLEYYAFDQQREQAQTAFRTLARRSLKDFIYSALGYDPSNAVPPAFIQLQDRMMLNTVPRGYFSVFREISDILISAAQNGLRIDSHTMPDGSVGRTWSGHWTKEQLHNRFGQRAKHPHVFPDYFPQAQAANEIETWVYPLPALGDFRLWLQEVYLPEKYPAYLDRKIKDGALEASRATLLLAAVMPGQDEDE